MIGRSDHWWAAGQFRGASPPFLRSAKKPEPREETLGRSALGQLARHLLHDPDLDPEPGVLEAWASLGDEQCCVEVVG